MACLSIRLVELNTSVMGYEIHNPIMAVQLSGLYTPAKGLFSQKGENKDSCQGRRTSCCFVHGMQHRYVEEAVI